jgi:hypothetical protein
VRACGNVNPEQIFNILEAKLVDEFGNETDQRRIGPEAWNEVFRAQMEGRVAQVPDESDRSQRAPSPFPTGSASSRSISSGTS